MQPTSGSLPTSPELAPEVQGFIRSEQERGYRNLAIKLGLGADPQKAYERLSGTSGAQVAHSPYEDQRRYQIMSIIAGSVFKALDDGGAPRFHPLPAFASLPTGDVNARTEIEPKTKVPVIFFEQGLMRFFYDFCHLIGWAVPPLSPEQLGSDEVLSEMARSYTMPPEASSAFVASLGSYVFDGSPMAAAPGVEPPLHNMPLSMTLLNVMERFVMVHELSHVKLGHLEKPAAASQEFEADEASLRLVTYMCGQEGLAWGVAYWACDLALIALQLLCFGISVGEFGKRVGWADKTHPDPMARREALKQMWLDPGAPEAGVKAARVLCGMSVALGQRLWEFLVGPLLISHNSGARPSPMWRGLIEDTFVESN